MFLLCESEIVLRGWLIEREIIIISHGKIYSDAYSPTEPLEWHHFLLVPIVPLVPMDHWNCPVPNQVTWENNLSPLNEMYIHQQNHWNDIPFYWYQWTIGLTNRICLCILDMCGGSKTRWRNITKLWVSKRGILWIHRLHHVIVPRWGKDAVAVSVQVNDNQFTLQVLFSENTVHFRCSRTGEFSIFSSTRLRNTFN